MSAVGWAALTIKVDAGSQKEVQVRLRQLLDAIGTLLPNDEVGNMVTAVVQQGHTSTEADIARALVKAVQE